MVSQDGPDSSPRPVDLSELAAELRLRCAPALASGVLSVDEVEQLARDLRRRLDDPGQATDGRRPCPEETDTA